MIGWLVKGHPYVFKTVVPGSADTNYSLFSIWINISTNIAYVLSSIVNGQAEWNVKQPNSVINDATVNQINVIGETYIRGIAVVFMEGKNYMLKSVYDADSDGIVDEVESIDGGMW